MFNPETRPNQAMISRIREAAPGMEVQLKFISVRNAEELRVMHVAGFEPIKRGCALDSR